MSRYVTYAMSMNEGRFELHKFDGVEGLISDSEMDSIRKHESIKSSYEGKPMILSSSIPGIFIEVTYLFSLEGKVSDSAQEKEAMLNSIVEELNSGMLLPEKIGMDFEGAVSFMMKPLPSNKRV